MDTPPGILAGLRVIDCATYIAGPAAATLLSDFGADVIKIERPPYGDPYRYLSLVPGMPESEKDYCWILTSRNKRSVALNLEDNSARDALLRLVTHSDVFITNYQPATVRKLRLAYDDLSPLNPRLVYAYLTGYGETGPDVGQPGYDMTAYWARSGLMASMHNSDAEPCQSPAGFGDHPTSVALFSAILLALYQRQATGRGGKVSTSLIANGAWSHACSLQAALAGAEFQPRWTRKNAINPVVNHYLTSDGRRFVLCCVDPHRDWVKLCSAIGMPELAGDERFSTASARRASGAALVALLDSVFGRGDMAYWVKRFSECGVIWGQIPSTQEVACDPQMQANNVFVEVDDPRFGRMQTVNSPMVVDGAPKSQPRACPLLGQHTIEVLREAGYDEAAIRQLLESGAASHSAVV